MIKNQEVELKLEIAAADVGACRELHVLGDARRASVEQITSYFDTPQGNLRKAGFSLRIRRRRRTYWQTVKHRGGEAGGFSSRAEWEQQLDGPELDFAALAATPVGALLSKRDMKKRLTRVSETRVRRTTWLVRHGTSEIEVILDEGEVASGDRREAISELELELKKGKRADLFDLAKGMAKQVPLRMGVSSKSERGFQLLEGRTKRARKAQRVRLNKQMTVAEAFAAVVQSCLRHFRQNEGLISADSQGGPLHQARVAMRRLRSAFTLFRPAIADEDYERLRESLRTFALKLGDARNLDVMLADRSGAGNKSAREARGRLRKQRDLAYEKVQQALVGADLPYLILEIVAWAECGRWRDSDLAKSPIGPFAAERLDRRRKRVRREARGFEQLDAEQRHRLRIDVKKLRYACEFFAGLVANERRAGRKAFISKLEQIQESLGKLNDLETARQLAPEIGEGERDEQASNLLRLTEHNLKALRAMTPYWRG